MISHYFLLPTFSRANSILFLDHVLPQVSTNHVDSSFQYLLFMTMALKMILDLSVLFGLTLQCVSSPIFHFIQATYTSIAVAVFRKPSQIVMHE